VWVGVPTGEVFVPGQVVTEEPLVVRVGQDQVVGPKQVRRAVTHGMGAQDACALTQLNDACLLKNLEQRFCDPECPGGMYTWVGPVLAAVNPYEALPIYGADTIAAFRRAKTATQSAPHPFAVAAQAHRQLLRSGRKQGILISGESGAGKTETAKHVMKYLAADSEAGVEKKLLGVNPILEGFGNAKTLRNDNSSRFGKLLRLHFQQKSLTGASVETYLLARSRVTQVPAQERNYHAFYALCNGLSKEDPLTEQLWVHPAENFRYLVPPEEPDGQLYMEDSTFLQSIRDALSSLGVTPEQEQEIFRAVMAVLWLGNVEFEETGQGCALVESSRGALERAASLLGVAADEGVEAAEVLLALLTEVKVLDRTRRLSKAKAEAQRDAVARAVYVTLFDGIVTLINDKLGSAAVSSDSDIGVLDIFGFENMPTNSFEQLCINYANEKLHQFFLQQVIVQEQAEYRHEGIAFREVTPQDNSAVIDLLAAEAGVFDLLNSITGDSMRLAQLDGQSRQNNDHFSTKVHELGGKTAGLISLPRSHNRRPCRKEQVFCVAHTAESVVYTADGFVEKNKDDDATVAEVLLRSSHPLLRRDPASGGNRGRTSRCIAGKFQRQVDALMAELAESSCHYIRCVKPNEQRAAGVFDAGKVYQQLKVGGMFELLVLMSLSYPTRIPYSDLFARYGPLLHDDALSVLGDGAPAERLLVTIILSLLQQGKFEQVGVDALQLEDFAMGTSKVFFRPQKMEPVESLREICAGNPQAAAEVAQVIAAEIRRRRILRVKAAFRACVLLGRRARALRSLATVARQLRVVTRVRSVASRWVRRAVEPLRRRRAAAVTVHAALRSFSARRTLERLRREARAGRVIRAAVLVFLARRRLAALRRARSAAGAAQGEAGVSSNNTAAPPSAGTPRRVPTPRPDPEETDDEESENTEDKKLTAQEEIEAQVAAARQRAMADKLRSAEARRRASADTSPGKATTTQRCGSGSTAPRSKRMRMQSPYDEKENERRMINEGIDFSRGLAGMKPFSSAASDRSSHTSRSSSISRVLRFSCMTDDGDDGVDDAPQVVFTRPTGMRWPAAYRTGPRNQRRLTMGPRDAPAECSSPVKRKCGVPQGGGKRSKIPRIAMSG